MTWYRRQFGDTKHFALSVDLYADPHPGPGETGLERETWGSLELWANGHCLTRSIQSGTVRDGIEWYLHHFWSWASRQAVPLFNEEPFPGPTKHEQVASAVEWMSASEDPPWTLTESDEDRWFQQRSDWRRRHALRAAFPGAAAPNVFMRRQGDYIEFSWDNQLWPASRPDTQFVESKGSARVGARHVERAWLEYLDDFQSAVSRRTDGMAGLRPAEVAPSARDWSWLLPQSVASALRAAPHFARLVASLDARASAATLTVPHSVETLLLRDCGAMSSNDIGALLGLRSTAGSASDLIEGLRRPRPAPDRSPWSDGYDAALTVRETLGWGDDPAPERLAEWLAAQGVDVEQGDYSEAVDSALIARAGHQPRIAVNAKGRRSRTLSPKMLTAASLGAFLLDADPRRDFGLVLGAGGHWPTTARAKAFAAMLLMPEDGIRAFLAERKSEHITPSDLAALMQRYGTTVRATAYHLNHMGLIDNDERDELMTAALSAA